MAEVSEGLSGEERFRIGNALREIVDQMDRSCEAFNSHVLFSKMVENRWEAFPQEFQKERREYLENCDTSKGVYVHGDLNPDNILMNADGEIYIIDFADALIAPIELELAAIICDGLKFEPDYLNDFLGEYDKNVVAEQLLYGLLIHDYGMNIIRDNIGAPSEIYSLKELRDNILERLG